MRQQRSPCQRMPKAGLLLLALACGQSSRSVGDPEQPVPTPGDLADPCPPPVVSQMGSGDVTVFGASAEEMLAGVLPSAPSPLFWVAYDALRFTPSYAPGVSETTLTLTIAAVENAVVVQHVSLPPPGDPEFSCGPTTVELPVHLALASADGALDERADGVLEFRSRHTAALSLTLPADGRSGSLAFNPTEELSDWTLQGLGISVNLWPGGSSGHVAPSFLSRHPTTPPISPKTSEAAFEQGTQSGPWLPQHWNNLAVWPHRERCNGATAYDATDRILGWSPQQGVAELATRSERTLATSDGSTPVRFRLDDPAGLLCVQIDSPQLGDLTFPVQGRLTAVGAAAGSTFEHLDASSNFWLSMHAANDGSAIDRLRWERDPYALTAQKPADFNASTGLDLEVPDGDDGLVWSWQGTDQLAAAAADAGAAAWTLTGQFQVQAAKEETGMICQGAFAPPAGAPAPTPDCRTVTGVRLGDTILRAQLQH